MNELSSDARSLLSRTRTAHEPRPAERERVRRALALRLAGGAALTASAASAATTASGALGGLIVVKAILSGFLLGTLSVGLVVLTSEDSGGLSAAVSSAGAPAPRVELRATDVPRSPHPVADLVQALPLPSPSPAVPTASGAAAARVARPVASGAPSEMARSAADVGREALELDNVESGRSHAVSPAAAAFPASTAAAATARPEARPNGDDSERLTAEARALAEVQRTLDQGAPALALELLNRHERKFAGGALAQERAAARVFVLCALGRKLEAQREGIRFLAAAPQSPLSARVKAACAKPGVSR